MAPTTLLGGLTPQQFLRDYWHKQPLLVRGAIPNFKPVLAAPALFALAAQEEVESRLITHRRKQWQMQNGPFDQLPPTTQKAWTLLVQGVNLHHEDADALLQHFRFIPDARLDDLMVSYATDGGGVGPHFDSYDVFLLQADGHRRWRISAQKDLSLLENVPLKLLKNFEAEQEYLLEPGDMLYLPPHYAHDGVAEGACMTYSIGFRAPSYQELAEAFLQFMADSVELPGRYADPDLSVSAHPAEIGEQMFSRITAELSKLRFSGDDMAIFLGEYLSEPKSNVFFDRPVRPLSAARFLAAASRRGLKLSPKTRMLYRGRNIFMNGESFSAKRQDKRALQRLANYRKLTGTEAAAAPPDVLEALHAWYLEGWLDLG